MSFGKSSPTPPATTASTVTQVPEYAPEQREYVADVFGKAQELYEQRTEEGFQPFPGAQMAPFQAQEEEAFAGIESLARGPGAAPAFEVARTASLGAAAPITAGEVQGLMNPYQQAVTDIAKREAVRQYQRGPQQQMRTAAVGEGGLRGARRFIEEAEGQRNLQQQLSDIQMAGSQQAYQQAMAEAAASRGRLANLATQMPGIGTGAYQQQMAQLGQLGGVGEAQRAREQAAIDLAQTQFQQELMFPEETLATYLRFITNAPSPSGFQQTTVKPVAPGPGTLQQLAGLGLSAASAGKAFNLFNRGGAVGRRAGLSGIVRRSGGGQIVRLQTGSIGNTGGFGGYFGDFEKYYKRPQDYVTGFTPPTTPPGGEFGYNTTQVDKIYEELTPKETDYSGLLVGEPTPIPTPAPAPEPKPEPETVRDEVDDSLDKLNKPRLDDAAYLDIAAAALKGAYEPGTIGRETGFVESLGKVLSPAAAAAAAGMRETKKAQREEEALEMSRAKEEREAGAQEFINNLRKSQAEYYSAKPDIDKLTARNKYLKLLVEGINDNTIPAKEGEAEIRRILGQSATGAGSGDQSDDSLATGDPRNLGS